MVKGFGCLAMKRTLSSLTGFSFEIAFAVTLGFVVAFVTLGPPQEITVLAAGTSEPAPVVVELFTSEGCSSCPPADALLARYEQEQPFTNTQVIALEEHVDYWNEQGWVDPFSSREYTERQADYATVLKKGNPYTPQMVIDGRTELVGNRERLAREAIAQAAGAPKSEVTVAVEGGASGRDQHLQVTVNKLAGGSERDAPEVWLAVTESGLHSDVKRGENAGRELSHASVVRVLRKVGTADRKKEIAFSRSVTFGIDSGWKRQNLRAVIFVQERGSRRILGAAAVGMGL
jgi:hypothetical protein